MNLQGTQNFGSGCKWPATSQTAFSMDDEKAHDAHTNKQSLSEIYIKNIGESQQLLSTGGMPFLPAELTKQCCPRHLLKQLNKYWNTALRIEAINKQTKINATGFKSWTDFFEWAAALKQEDKDKVTFFYFSPSLFADVEETRPSLKSLATSFPNINTLAINRKFIKQDLCELPNFKNIKKLIFEWPNPLTDADLEEIAKLADLEHLDLGFPNPITDIGVKKLSALTKLRHLSITNGENITNEGLLEICKLTELRYLLIWGGQFTDEGFKEIAKLTHLKRLDLNSCDKITHVGLKALTGLPITFLNLFACDGISDKAIDTIATLNRLENLNLSRCTSISDEKVKEIASRMKLQSSSNSSRILELCP